MSDNIVEIKRLFFKHDNGRVVFEDITLHIPRGKITVIMGPSGTGKTTLLRIIGGQWVPNAGEVNVCGQPIHQLSRPDLYQLRKRMGLLFQEGGLFTHLNVFENVAFPLREHTNLNEAMIYTIVMLKLQMVGLRGAAKLMPNELSGGMNRRVALARAIALDPELIMYDEPFAGQDPISMGVLLRLIRTLNDALGLTTIIVSHDVQEALQISDYAYVISDKKIIGQGTPSEVLNQSLPALTQFVQGLPDGPVPFHYPASPLVKDLLREEV